MTQHRFARSPAAGAPRGSADRWPDLDRNEVTDIIPFNEFGSLDDLDFSDNCAFDNEVQVLRAPELDDLDDTDDLTPLWLAAPSEPDPGIERCADDSYPYLVAEELDELDDDVDTTAIPWRRGQHRKPASSAVRGRVLITAMAAGAAAAAAHSATHPSNAAKTETVLAADASPLNGGATTTSARGMQMITVKPAANIAVHNEELAKGVAFAQERAQREAGFSSHCSSCRPRAFSRRTSDTAGGAARRHRHREFDRNPDPGGVRRCGHRCRPDRRLRDVGQAAPRRRNRHALRSRQQHAGQRRPAGDGGRSDRHHGQPR
ncbi:hypothetical protein I552_1717 [Mycobacterium xenopi 3993]|nr:hypothetical protein I552_1717 [Mycobacterium xenopi 3993]